MTPSLYTEDTLVQQTTADYLQERLGWESVYAHNHEDFGPDGLLGRASDRDVVLVRPLRERLAALNPGLPEAARDEAVRQLTATLASQTIVAANREKYALIRDGVPVTFRNDRGERVRERLRVLDFERPATSALPARRCSPATSSRGGCSATTSRPVTSSARWRTRPPCPSTTTPAATSWGWRSGI